MISVIGAGFVGSAVIAYLEAKNQPPIVYDKYKQLGSMAEAATADFIFVCVPTPMKLADGACDVSIVYSVVTELASKVKPTAVVIIKSTVPIGFMDELSTHFSSMKFVYFPEFLTEKNAVDDFATCNRMILGGDSENTEAVRVLFLGLDEYRVHRMSVRCMPFKEAEAVKLVGNTFLMMKVLYANEIFALCAKLGIDYSRVQNGIGLDPRIGTSHLGVPGHDGMFGAGGACFPKDMENLRKTFKDNGVPERVLTAVALRNVEVRKEAGLMAGQLPLPESV